MSILLMWFIGFVLVVVLAYFFKSRGWYISLGESYSAFQIRNWSLSETLRFGFFWPLVLCLSCVMVLCLLLNYIYIELSVRWDGLYKESRDEG